MIVNGVQVNAVDTLVMIMQDWDDIHLCEGINVLSNNMMKAVREDDVNEMIQQAHNLKMFVDAVNKVKGINLTMN